MSLYQYADVIVDINVFFYICLLINVLPDGVFVKCWISLKLKFNSRRNNGWKTKINRINKLGGIQSLFFVQHGNIHFLGLGIPHSVHVSFHHPMHLNECISKYFCYMWYLTDFLYKTRD